uniref:Uncharacterized protein n=1 Tax=Plectus sambesii TaxID=2011161 RepID=A0A914WK11_9BILA
MFWYDQCRGTSRNLFDDMLTCQWMCEEQPMYKAKSCLEPFDEHYRDECNGGRWRQLYYFDKVEKNCRSFWYDGCTGESQNIYSDEITCQALCENPVKTDPHKPWHHKDKHKEIEMVHNIHQFDPCAPKPCMNGGTCSSTTNTKTQETTFECTCSPGYSGDTCDSQPCEVNPCFNNGTCATSKGLSTFYCNCPLGFAGKLCDIVIGETKPKYGSKVTQLSSGKVEWIEKLKKTYAAQSTEPSSKTPTKSTDKPMKETVKIKATFKSLNVTEGMNSSSIVLNDGEMNEFDEPAAMKQAQTQMKSDIKGTGGVLDMKNSGGILIANGLALCMIHVCCMFICRIW